MTSSNRWNSTHDSLFYTGAPSTDCNAGNWNEDLARQEVAAKDYEARRSQGDLLYLRKRKERNFLSQPSVHSFSADGLVHYGDTVQLATGSGDATRYICSNIFTQVVPGSTRVTAGADATPIARNTVVIQKPASSKSRDDVVRFGDRVMLACNPLLVADPATGTVGLQYLLKSSMASNVLGNTRKGRQECVMSTRRDADAEWYVYHVTGDRLMTDGEPVQAGDDVVLLHAMSNVALAGVSSETYPTEFGSELDVHCQTHKATAHSSMKQTGEMPMTAAQGPNRWRFVYASSPDAAIDSTGRFEAMKPLSTEALLESARQSIAATTGIHGMRSLSLAFSSLDAKGTGSVPADGARWAMYQHGAQLGEDEFQLMLRPFTDRSGFIHSKDLLEGLRGETYSASRAEAVKLAYEHLSRSTSGSVTVGQLKKVFDSKWDPRTVSKAMTGPEATLEFSRQWPAHKASTDAVTFAQFEGYYRDVSACMGDDWEFSDFVFNAWHVPGCGHWKQKAGKRVLVTFHKGSSSEAVIPGGEDIHDDDFEGLVAALEKMGMGGIARVKVLGLVEAD